MKDILRSLPARLLAGVLAGILIGLAATEGMMQVILTCKNLMGSLISFCVPLIVIGFIAPSITRLKANASRMLVLALILAYVSSVCAAFMAMAAGYGIIPHMSIQSSVDGLRELPARRALQGAFRRDRDGFSGKEKTRKAEDRGKNRSPHPGRKPRASPEASGEGAPRRALRVSLS